MYYVSDDEAEDYRCQALAYRWRTGREPVRTCQECGALATDADDHLSWCSHRPEADGPDGPDDDDCTPDDEDA